MGRDYVNRLSDKLLMRIFRLSFQSQFSDKEPNGEGPTFSLAELQTIGHEPRRDLRTFPFPLHSGLDIPRNISAVCRAWRTLTLQMPDLWASMFLGPTEEDVDQEMLDEWLFRQNEEPIDLFVDFGSPEHIGDGNKSGDPLFVFQFRHNADRLRSITFDLRSEQGDFQALQKTFVDLGRVKPPSLRKIFIQLNAPPTPPQTNPNEAPIEQEEEQQAAPDAHVPSLEEALQALPPDLLLSLEEYGIMLPARCRDFMPLPQGPTQLRVLHILLPLNRSEIVKWLNLCPNLVDARFRLSGGEDENGTPVGNVPNLRSLRLSCDKHERYWARRAELESHPLHLLLDKINFTAEFREIHFDSERGLLIPTILAFLEKRNAHHTPIETLSLHGASFKLHYPQKTLDDGAFEALRQLRRLNVHERFLGQSGIVSAMIERCRENGELALPFLEELSVLEYNPSSPEDVASFIYSHSFTRRAVSASATGLNAHLKYGSLRRVVFTYNTTKRGSVPPMVANLAHWQGVADCVRNGLEISVRLGSQLALVRD